MTIYRYRQAKDAHTLICTHRHTLFDVCICTRRNRTACMHACTHLCMCIQGHIHTDKLFILLRVSSNVPLQKSDMFTDAVCRDNRVMSSQSLYLKKASSGLS